MGFFKCLGTPCYLVVVSGSSFFLGGLYQDTRMCFLWCRQVSSSSSLLFNIEFWSAVRITSFLVIIILWYSTFLQNPATITAEKKNWKQQTAPEFIETLWCSKITKQWSAIIHTFKYHWLYLLCNFSMYWTDFLVLASL